MPYVGQMVRRTTLAIGDDVLLAAKARSDHERRPVGDIVTEWARNGMNAARPKLTTRNGLPVLPRRGVVITSEFVNALRDELE